MSIIGLMAAISPQLESVPFALSMAGFGAGIGLVISQMGNIVMSSVGEERSSEAGGVQGAAQNLGQSLGTALIGAVLLAGLTSGFVDRVRADSSLPPRLVQKVEQGSEQGVPMISTAQAEAAVKDAHLPPTAGRGGAHRLLGLADPRAEERPARGVDVRARRAVVCARAAGQAVDGRCAAVSGYVQPPEGWTRVRADGPGPFVTTEVFRRPDGTEVRWQSRAHRKGAPAREPPTGAAQERVWWRPRRRSWWMAVLFALGSACFLAGGIASQSGGPSTSAIGVTFFVGSIFFTTAAYLQYSEVVNVDHALTAGQRRARWRPASWEPRRIDWLAALVQVIGTVAFNISTFSALNDNLSTHQLNARVWAPDAFGSIAFLISSELAFAEVCHRWVCWRRRGLPWRIVALNLLGSIAFGVSAVASLLEPSSGTPVSARIANAGTSVGGACFLIAALLLMPEAAAEERASRSSQAALLSSETVSS